MKDYPVVFMLGFFVTVVFNRWVTIFQYIGFTDKWVFQQFYIKKNIFIFKNQTILIVLLSLYVKFYIWTFKTFSTLVTFIKNYSFMKLGKKSISSFIKRNSTFNSFTLVQKLSSIF